MRLGLVLLLTVVVLALVAEVNASIKKKGTRRSLALDRGRGIHRSMDLDDLRAVSENESAICTGIS